MALAKEQDEASAQRLGRLRAHSLAIVCESPCPVISV